MTSQYTVYIEQDEDGIFIGSIPSILNCNAQGDSQEEMLKNLEEVIELCTRNTPPEETITTTFIGITNIPFSHAKTRSHISSEVY